MFIIRAVILHFCYKLDGFTFWFIFGKMLVSHFCYSIGKIFGSDFLIYWRFFADNLMADLGAIYNYPLFDCFLVFLDSQNFCSKISRKIFYESRPFTWPLFGIWVIPIQGLLGRISKNIWLLSSPTWLSYAVSRWFHFDGLFGRVFGWQFLVYFSLWWLVWVNF